MMYPQPVRINTNVSSFKTKILFNLPLKQILYLFLDYVENFEEFEYVQLVMFYRKCMVYMKRTQCFYIRLI